MDALHHSLRSYVVSGERSLLVSEDCSDLGISDDHGCAGSYHNPAYSVQTQRRGLRPKSDEKAATGSHTPTCMPWDYVDMVAWLGKTRRSDRVLAEREAGVSVNHTLVMYDTPASRRDLVVHCTTPAFGLN